MKPSLKGKGEVAEIGQDLPENAKRRRRLVTYLAAAPLLGSSVFLLATGYALDPLAIFFSSGGAVFPLAICFVTGYFLTSVFDVFAKAADLVTWPLLRWLGRGLATSVRDETRVSPFLRDEDPLRESSAIRSFIPDSQWVPSVGGLVAVHLGFFAASAAKVAALGAGAFATGLAILAAWTAVLAGVALLALRTAAGRYRSVIGAIWVGRELIDWAARMGRRARYLTESRPQLEAGVDASAVACPYCAAPLGTAPRVACEACHTPHHADCWREFGRCTVYACPGEVGRAMG